MADIELLIKIPDHLYKLLKDFPSDSNESTIENVLMKAVEHGTPLPKGHGRLIDADAFQKTYCKENCGDRPCVDAMDRCIFIGELLLAPTIIDADKEQSDE